MLNIERDQKEYYKDSYDSGDQGKGYALPTGHSEITIKLFGIKIYHSKSSHDADSANRLSDKNKAKKPIGYS
jgi:hypothetical protein